jgi:hypothetical protein
MTREKTTELMKDQTRVRWKEHSRVPMKEPKKVLTTARKMVSKWGSK